MIYLAWNPVTQVYLGHTNRTKELVLARTFTEAEMNAYELPEMFERLPLNNPYPEVFEIPGMGAKVVGLVKTKYPAGGGLAVILLLKWPTTEDPDSEIIEDQPISVNLTDREQLAMTSPGLPENHFYAKNWSEMNDIYEQCIRHRIFEETGVRAATGFVKAPLCKITPKGIAWIEQTRWFRSGIGPG